MARRTLKIKEDIPFWLENKLVNKYGYTISKRFKGEFVLFVKFGGTQVSSNNTEGEIKHDVPSLGRQLTQAEEFVLEQRCDNIADWFADPYKMTPSVRARLNNMRRALNSQEEQQFVLEYMDYNFPLNDQGK